jgi:two-component sensor histidine kinase
MEQQRLDAVRAYEILDTAPEAAFDHITTLAAQLLRVPIALVSIVDDDRIWFKSRHGLDLKEIGRTPGLCASCILQERPWVVSDVRADPRAAANPLVLRLGVQFYLGVPLRTKAGFNLGALSVLDFEPREATEDEISLLIHLAIVVMDELELRLSARRALSQYHQELGRRELREDHIRALLRELSHRSKNLLAVVLALAQHTVPRNEGVHDYVVRLSSRVRGLALTHDLIADEEWKGAALADLAARQLQPFISEDSSQVKFEGPSLILSPMAAQNIGLALHELATNAVKYGALSQPRGTVHVAWHHRPPRLSVIWTEHDGPSVSPPTQKGFGHTVLARLVPEALDGDGLLSFNLEGFRWILDIPARHAL